jgi:formylmethanofuran dehydrogenase subunit E
LGVRSALVGSRLLGLDASRRDKRLLIVVETDGCFADGIEVVSGATVGHRTLRIEDSGKIAATFIDVHSRRSIRIAPQVGLRERAWGYAPGENRHYFAQLRAYQLMPDFELLTYQEVLLLKPVEAIISQAGLRVDCQVCGEEVFNQREIWQGGRILCRTCAGEGFYRADHPPCPIPETPKSLK